jgi:hypothetical protein
MPIARTAPQGPWTSAAVSATILLN